MGASLSTLLAGGNPLPNARVASLLLFAIAGVRAVHEAGVVHRDLKPHNIFIRKGIEQEDAVVIDFGVAKSIYSEDTGPLPALTTSGMTLGTPGYMAPEQILCARSVDFSTDQYALGVTLYQCLTGKLPFCGSSAYEVMHATVHGSAVHPCELNHSVPKELGEVALRAMQRNPCDRYPSLEVMSAALQRFATVVPAPFSSVGSRQSRVLTPADEPSDDTSRRGASPSRGALAELRRRVLVLVIAAIAGTALAAWSGSRLTSVQQVKAHAPPSGLTAVRASGANDGVEIPLPDPTPSSAAEGNPTSVSDTTTATDQRPKRLRRKVSSGYSGLRGANGAPIVE